MASSYLNRAKIQFFKVVSEHDKNLTIEIPSTTIDGTDTITITSKWSSADVQGGTQSLVAYDSVDNPNLPIQLKFNKDLCSEFGISYTKTINNFARIQYPVEVGNKIKPPYCKIQFDGRVYRGYFTNVRITLSGPYLISRKGKRDKYRSQCEVSAQFVLSPKIMIRNKRIDILGNMT